MNKILLVRADGNSKIGIGHITRCLYFVGYLQQSYRIIFCFVKNTSIKDFISSRGFEICELDPNLSISQEIKIIKKISSELLILDVKNKNDKYYKDYADNFEKILRFDDTDDRINIYSDLYLNYNLYSKDLEINLLNKNAKLFLGPEYYILNPIFTEYGSYKRQFNSDKINILLTMGGGDPNNLTIRLLKILVNFNDLHINVILGKLFKNFNEIEQFQKRYHEIISIYKNINNMPEMMAKNDIIIGTGGNTSFEAAYMGIPGILINQIELQSKNGIIYEEMEIFKNGGLGEKINDEEIRMMIYEIINSKSIRKKMSKNGKDLFGSKGIGIVIENFKN